jgi:GT2 family glycosyltransferase
MSSLQPLVDVVIPHYNGVDFLATCLSSLFRQSYSAFSVTIVDNGSSDHSLEFIQTNFPAVRIISWPVNKGFSPAVNAGIRAGKAPLVFLLNNDTELEPDCLQALVQTALAQSDYDFFAAKMLNFQQRHLLDGAGEGFLRGGAGYRLGTMERDDGFYQQPRRVFGACAGAALYRRQLFETIGLFDEDFFAYLEDVDFNVRANGRGKKCFFVPEARVFHIGSATSGSKINPFTVKLSTRNNFNVLVKNYPLSFFFRLFPVICVYQLFWLAFVVKKRQFPAYLRGVIEFFASLPLMLKKRQEVLAQMTLSSDELARIFALAEQEVVASIMRRRESLGKTNHFLSFYTHLFGL